MVVDLTKVTVKLQPTWVQSSSLTHHMERKIHILSPVLGGRCSLSLGSYFLLAWKCTWAHFRLTEVWLGLEDCLPLGCEEASGVPLALREAPAPGGWDGMPSETLTKLPWEQRRALP